MKVFARPRKKFFSGVPVSLQCFALPFSFAEKTPALLQGTERGAKKKQGALFHVKRRKRGRVGERGEKGKILSGVYKTGKKRYNKGERCPRGR